MEHAKLRKYENILAVSGAAVFAFGLWSIVKAVLYFIIVPYNQLNIDYSNENIKVMHYVGLSNQVISHVLIVVVLFVLLVDLLARLYIGRSAVIDGRRIKRKSIVYVIIAIIMAAGLVSSIIHRFTPSGTEADMYMDIAGSGGVSTILDLTSLFALVEMIIAAIMVRKLRKKLGKDETEVM